MGASKKAEHSPVRLYVSESVGSMHDWRCQVTLVTMACWVVGEGGVLLGEDSSDRTQREVFADISERRRDRTEGHPTFVLETRPASGCFQRGWSGTRKGTH